MIPPLPAAAQTTYHLHNAASDLCCVKDQLKVGPSESAVATVQTSDLRGTPIATGQSLEYFVTVAGDPGVNGTVATGATATVNFWMRKTASFGTFVPYAAVYTYNINTGYTLRCTTPRGGALTTAFVKYTLSCTTSAFTMTQADRWQVLVGYDTTVAPGNHSVMIALTFEGTPGGNYDSLFVAPTITPAPPPTITNLTPNAGPIGSSVTITGSMFGATQGASTVKFNGVTATASSWSDQSILTSVPPQATTGPVVVTAATGASTGVAFTVTPAPWPLVTQAANGQGSGAPAQTATFASTPVAGDLIAVFFTHSAGGCVHAAPTDTAGNTYTQAGSMQRSSWADNIYLSMWYAKNIGTAANFKVTANCSSGSVIYWSVVAVEITGADTMAPYNGDFASDNDFTSTAFGISTAVAPPANSLALAGTNTNCPSNAVTNGTGWSSIANERQSNANVDLYVEHSAVGAAYTAAWTSSSCSHEYLTASFRPPPPPSILSLTPSSGALGQAITIDGSLFGATQGSGTVTFNGVASTPSSWTDTRLIVTVPTGATTGPVVVTANGHTSAGATFTVRPGITSLSPASGLVGASVTITGSKFGAVQGSSIVAFNGAVAAISTWSDTSIVAAVPVAATTGPVVVTAGGQSSDGAGFTVLGGPSLGSLTPASGAVGTAVVIAGSGFGTTQGSSTVTFNGTPATVATWSDTTIAMTVPTGASSGPVVVSVGGASSNGRAFTVIAGTVSYEYDARGQLIGVVDPAGQAATYSYDAVGNLLAIGRSGAGSVSVVSFLPLQGRAGSTVRIFGNGFSTVPAENTVTFNGTSATVTASTTTALTVTVPTVATTGLIAATSPLGSATSNQIFTVGTSAPAITGFDPVIGTAGTTITISGTNFSSTAANDRTQLNAAFAAVTTATSTALTTSVPPLTSSGRWAISTPTGAAVSSGVFIVPPAAYLPTDVDSYGQLAFATPTVATVSTAGKIAIWVFDGTAGQNVSLNIPTQTVSQAHITMYAPDMSVVLAPGALYPGTNHYLGRITLPMTGVYAIVYAPDSTYTGTLTLTLYNVAPDISGTLAHGGPASSFSITTPGQRATYTFAGTAGAGISLNTSNNTIDLTSLTILNPDGSSLFGGSVGGYSTYSTGTLTLPATGTYTVHANALDVYTGKMSLTLLDVGGPESVTTLTHEGHEADAPNQRGSIRWIPSVRGEHTPVGFYGITRQQVPVSTRTTSIRAPSDPRTRPSSSSR
jgi:YD repeat-containing protein